METLWGIVIIDGNYDILNLLNVKELKIKKILAGFEFNF